MKYGILLTGTLFLVNPLWILIDPNATVTVNGEQQLATITDSITLSIIPIIFISIGIVFYLKLRQINFSYSEIKIYDNLIEIKKTWLDVDKIKMFRSVAPPLYSIKFKGEHRTHWFVTKIWFISIPFYTWDLSEMGDVIQQKKKALRI